MTCGKVQTNGLRRRRARSALRHVRGNLRILRDFPPISLDSVMPFVVGWGSEMVSRLDCNQAGSNPKPSWRYRVMHHPTRIVQLCHVTPRRNLPSIWRNGLLPHFARGVLPVVWFCTPSRRRWASVHVCDQNATSDVIVLRLRLPRAWLRRFRRGIWHCAQPIPSSCIISVSLPSPVVSAA